MSINFTDIQAIMDRLYGGLASDGGTLLQLRNLINRRNVASKVKGRYNATIDFMESVVDCHVTAASMEFFGMEKTTDTPTKNNDFAHVPLLSTADQWKALQNVLTRLVDRFIFLQSMDEKLVCYYVLCKTAWS